MGNINTSGCYLINGIQFACSNDAGLIDLYNISTINGLPPGSGGGDGGGMPQTPWFSNINAANFGLYNLSSLNGQPVNLVPDYSTASIGDILAIGPSGVPVWEAPADAGMTQTPWLSNIDAANFSLSNLNQLNGLPVAYYLQTPWVQPVNANNNALYNVPVLQFPNGTQIYVNSTNNTMLLWGSNAGEVARAPFGISSSTSFLPQYSLDVVGSANISGCYYIQGIALACYNSGAAGFDLTNINTINGLPPGSGGGQNQTPWQSNIDANGYNLYNLNCVILGSGAPGPFYICIDINGSAQYSNKNQSGVIWMTQSGFLGIGIQQPLYSLDVYSLQDYSARIRSHTSFCGLIIDHDLTSGGESIVSFRSANNEAAIIQYDSDEDALIFWTGARDAAFSTLCCDTNSRVGILTTSPAYELDVNGDCNISGTYRVNGVPLSTGGGFWQGGSGGAIYYNGGNVGIGTTNPQTVLHVREALNQNIVFSGGTGTANIQATNDAVNVYVPLMYEAAGHYFMQGNVGIGTASPIGPLQVLVGANENAVFSNNAGFTTLSAVNNAGSAYVPMQYYASAHYLMGGNVGIGTASPVEALTVNGASRFMGTTTTASGASSCGIDYSAGYARWLSWGPNTSAKGGYKFTQLASDGTGADDAVVITPTGNVGIGTTSPNSAVRLESDLDASVNPVNLYLYQPSASWGTIANYDNYRFIQTNSAATDGGFKQFNVGGGGVGIAFAPPVYGSSDAMYVNGNVGIGTYTPTAQLHLMSYAASGQVFRVQNAANAGGSNVQVSIHTDQPYSGAYTGEVLRVQMYANAANNQGYVARFGTGNSDLSGFTNYLSISGDGKVNVGSGDAYSAGDLGVARIGAPTTGVIYFGNTTNNFIYWNGSAWQFSPPLPASGGGPTVQSVVTGSRAMGGVYQNTTGKPLYVNVSLSIGAAAFGWVYCDASSNPGTQVGRFSGIAAANLYNNIFFIVLPNYYYRVYDQNSATSILDWVEYY